VDASSLTLEERSALGIKTPLPKTLAQSLAALEADKALQTVLGPSFVVNYCRVKRAESEKLAAMGEHERRKWLIERY
jgi:glutamine synthetase